MSELDGLLKFIEGEVFGKVSKAEFLACKVNRIGSLMASDLQLFKIACRRKEIHFYIFLCHSEMNYFSLI